MARSFKRGKSSQRSSESPLEGKDEALLERALTIIVSTAGQPTYVPAAMPLRERFVSDYEDMKSEVAFVNQLVYFCDSFALRDMKKGTEFMVELGGAYSRLHDALVRGAHRGQPNPLERLASNGDGQGTERTEDELKRLADELVEWEFKYLSRVSTGLMLGRSIALTTKRATWFRRGESERHFEICLVLLAAEVVKRLSPSLSDHAKSDLYWVACWASYVLTVSVGDMEAEVLDFVTSPSVKLYEST